MFLLYILPSFLGIIRIMIDQLILK